MIVPMRKKVIAVVFSLFIVACLLVAYIHFQQQKTEFVPPTPESRFKRGHNIPGKLFWAGSAQDRAVALTFDDGPDEHWTPRILDILKEKNVKATFFVIGQQVQKHPDVLRRIYTEGHVVGDHTFDHADLTKLTPERVDQEIEECATVIRTVIGRTPKLVRPPFGFHNAMVDNTVYARNRVIILWSLDTEDWTGLDAAAIKARVLPKMRNGYIILQHSGVNPKLGGSVQALPDIIEGLRAQGYTFVTVAELLDTPPYQ
jgi:Predicted xylanase/chitin deacetylase